METLNICLYIRVVLCFQAPPSISTPEKSQEDEEAMPPYDAETQALIDGWFH